jgi:hypothetical protein
MSRQDNEYLSGGSSPIRLRVDDTPVGKGVFTEQSIPARVVVGEITGEVTEDEDYNSEYCFDVGDGQTLEPDAPFRFLNHCCEPNCEFDYFSAPDESGRFYRKRAFLVTLREILAGEELTIDYNWPAEDAIRCGCGSLQCRGWVVCVDCLDDVPVRATDQNSGTHQPLD